MTDTTSPLDHSGLAVLSRWECFDRLGRMPVGRIAFVSNGDPVIFPVNHALDGEAVVFRTNAGSKLLAADAESPVAFEVDGYDPERRTGWSVIVRGVATTVRDLQVIARLDRLGVGPWADVVDRAYWVRISTYGITGRQVVHPAET